MAKQGEEISAEKIEKLNRKELTNVLAELKIGFPQNGNLALMRKLVKEHINSRQFTASFYKIPTVEDFITKVKEKEKIPQKWLSYYEKEDLKVIMKALDIEIPVKDWAYLLRNKIGEKVQLEEEKSAQDKKLDEYVQSVQNGCVPSRENLENFDREHLDEVFEKLEIPQPNSIRLHRMRDILDNYVNNLNKPTPKDMISRVKNKEVAPVEWLDNFKNVDLDLVIDELGLSISKKTKPNRKRQTMRAKLNDLNALIQLGVRHYTMIFC